MRAKPMLLTIVYALGAVLVLVACSIGLLFAFNKQVMRSEAPRIVRLVVASLFPPDDLNLPAVQAEIDIGAAGSKGSFAWKPKYFGRYDFGLMWERRSMEDVRGQAAKASPLRLKLVCSMSDKEILMETLGQQASPFISKYGSGFAYLLVEVPARVPLDGTIRCDLEVLTPDRDLKTLFGPSHFVVRRISDK